MNDSQYERIGTGQTGMAGEHFVTGELLRRGWLAAMVHGNSPTVDILASKSGRTIQIQVKTRTDGAKGDTSLKPERMSPSVYYVLVDLLPEGARYFVVPGTALTEFYYRSPCGTRGRIPRAKLEQFKSRWDLLEA